LKTRTWFLHEGPPLVRKRPASPSIITPHTHTTHITQPLDECFFRSYKAKLRNEISLQAYEGITISKLNMAGAAKGVWDRIHGNIGPSGAGSEMADLVSGFESTGISPFNREKVINATVTSHADTLANACIPAAAATAAAATSPMAAVENDEEDTAAD
jgi:hypothetical protein